MDDEAATGANFGNWHIMLNRIYPLYIYFYSEQDFLKRKNLQ